MKTLAKFAIVAAIFVGGVLFALRVLNAVSVEAIERTLAFVFQTGASVDGARLSARDTTLELRGLSLGNPAGYDAEESFGFERATATIDPASIETGRPGVRLLVVHKPVITVEFEGKTTNLSTLIANASRFKSSEDDAPSTIPVYFDRIVFEEPSVVFLAPVITTPIRTPIPTFEVVNIGSAEQPVTASEAGAQIGREVLIAVTRHAADKLPDSLTLAIYLESVEAFAESATQYKDALEEKWGETKERLKGVREVLRDGALSRGQEALDRLRGAEEKEEE